MHDEGTIHASRKLKEKLRISPLVCKVSGKFLAFHVMKEKIRWSRIRGNLYWADTFGTLDD